MSAAVVVMAPSELEQLIEQAVRRVLSGTPVATAAPARVGWLTVPQAAEVAGVSGATMRRWLLAGEVPSKAILDTGRSTRIAAWWAAGKTNEA